MFAEMPLDNLTVNTFASLPSHARPFMLPAASRPHETI
jgi:hypothetical protein